MLKSRFLVVKRPATHLHEFFGGGKTDKSFVSMEQTVLEQVSIMARSCFCSVLVEKVSIAEVNSVCFKFQVCLNTYA